MNIRKHINGLLSVLAVFCMLSSCSTPKNIAYMQGVENAQILDIVSAGNAIKVQPYDKLSIIVTSTDPSLAQVFNLPVIPNNHVQRTSPNNVEFRNYNVGYSEGMMGYTVTKEGTIDFPVLGVLKVEGMTRGELAGFIKGEILGRGLLKEAQVSVEFLNIGVSVLGEVNRPGRFDLNSDQITLLEALSLAGDMSIQGQRENVKVLRTEGDQVKTYIINLTDAQALASSPAYYLKQGDIVYVEPNTIRKRQTTSNGNNVTNVSFWLSVASLLTSAAILFKK